MAKFTSTINLAGAQAGLDVRSVHNRLTKDQLRHQVLIETFHQQLVQMRADSSDQQLAEQHLGTALEQRIPTLD